LTVKAASDLVDQVLDLQPTDQKGYRYYETVSEYGEVPQRWFVIESADRRRGDLKTLSKTIERLQSTAQTALKRLSSQEFACATDATEAAEQLSLHLRWHQLSNLQIVEKRHYGKAGKPKKSEVPSRIRYQVSATITAVESEIAPHRVRCGRFILATNVLESAQLSVNQALGEYKAQQGTERGFRFMKDPLFFASSVFLKSPNRIAALGLIMGFCLLVYNLGQRQLRQALEQQAQTIPNQLGKPTATPTLRWVFQCFMVTTQVRSQG
jgi:transposase